MNFLFVGSDGDENKEKNFLKNLNDLNSRLGKSHDWNEDNFMFLSERTMGKWLNDDNVNSYSLFKFAIPELRSFVGRAIYIDVNCGVYGYPFDLIEIMGVKNVGWRPVLAYRSEVILIECSSLVGPQWPSIDFMRTSRWKEVQYLAHLQKISQIDFGKWSDWNCFGRADGNIKILRHVN